MSSTASNSAATSSSSANNGVTPTRSVMSSNSSSTLSNSYVNLCKVVLQHRLRNMFILTGFAAFGFLLFAVFDPKELPRSLVNFVPALLFSPLAFLGALPIFVYRKRTISTAVPSASTRFAQVDSLRGANSITTLIVFLLATLPLHMTYIWCASYASSEPRLGWLFYHSGRDAYQINERRILLTMLHLFLAVVSTVDHVLNSRSRLVFDDGPTRAIPQRLLLKTRARVARLLHSVVLSNALFYATYILLRKTVLKFTVVHFAGPWARPHLYSLLKHNAAYSITLAFRSFMSSLLILGMWQAANVCFEVYATQPMVISHFAPNANQCLISGLREDDGYYQHFAFLELELLTLTNPERRKTIFKEIKPESIRGGSWAEISRECLLVIGKELQRAKGRGNAKTSSPTANPQSAAAAAASSPGSSVPFKSEDIFKPTKKTFLDTLVGANGPPPPPAPSTSTGRSTAVATTTSAASSTTSRVPSIFQTQNVVPNSTTPSTTPASTATTPSTATPSPSSTSPNLEQKLKSWIPKPWQMGMFDPLSSHTVESCVMRRRVAICAINSLANLLCASLQEDVYGMAQKDIPRTLEAFVLYLNALDSLASELSQVADAMPQKEAKEQMQREIEEQVTSVQIALREGIRQVLTEFEPYLSTEFRFPRNIAHRLQLIADWG